LDLAEVAALQMLDPLGKVPAARDFFHVFLV
jgi:hypothetical protein